jgi:hypothetical protein
VYINDDDTWNHKFDFANTGAARDENDDSDVEYIISNHGLTANNNGSSVRWASYSDPSVTGSVPPTGDTSEEMTLAKDAIEVAADALGSTVSKALTAATIFEDMVAVATEGYDEDSDRFKFEWSYSNDKGDVANQCKFWASHDGGQSPDFDLTSQIAQVYNEFYVILGEDADTYQGALFSSSNDEESPDPNDYDPIPRPPNMSKAEKKKYGVSVVPDEKTPDLPDDASKDSKMWSASNFPVNIFDKS